MNPQQHSIITERTASVYTLGTPSDKVKHLWLVLHGYAHAAHSFIKPFAPLVNEETFILAPEALSRFYWKGVQGGVGASWMTKKDRLNEIRDYCFYLDRVVGQFKAQLSNPDLRLHLLGFSQGTATAWRWAMNGAYPPDTAIFWVGQTPNEYSDPFVKQLNSTRLFHVHALQDEMIPVEMAEKQVGYLRKRFPHMEFLTFEGKHRLNQKILLEIQARLG